jgi:hypothetical protein|tara:strand:+ start:279 stop:743 length:465 start_codon:yes stop_codon:yes gene_type:complete
MAYKQKPGRGKSNPFKAMEKYTSSPIKLENGDGDGKKTKIKEKKSKYSTESDVEGSPSPKGTRVVIKDGEVYASYRPKDTGTPKIKITGGNKPPKPPKTKSSYGKGRLSTFHNMPLKDRLKARLKGHKPTDARYARYGVAEEPVEGFNIITTKK